jgi:hypothetical protein
VKIESRVLLVLALAAFAFSFFQKRRNNEMPEKVSAWRGGDRTLNERTINDWWA